eukprot:1013959-Pleurochrysis_carterae.AAC.1
MTTADSRACARPHDNRLRQRCSQSQLNWLEDFPPAVTPDPACCWKTVAHAWMCGFLSHLHSTKYRCARISSCRALRRKWCRPVHIQVQSSLRSWTRECPRSEFLIRERSTGMSSLSRLSGLMRPSISLESALRQIHSSRPRNPRIKSFWNMILRESREVGRGGGGNCRLRTSGGAHVTSRGDYARGLVYGSQNSYSELTCAKTMHVINRKYSVATTSVLEKGFNVSNRLTSFSVLRSTGVQQFKSMIFSTGRLLTTLARCTGDIWHERPSLIN